MTLNVKVKWNGRQAKEAARRGAARGLMLGAEHILEETNRVVPISPGGGTLLRSGVPDVDGSALKASVSYDTPYAVRQHEELTWHHEIGRKAKYLEDTVNGPAGDRAKAMVAAEVKKELS